MKTITFKKTALDGGTKNSSIRIYVYVQYIDCVCLCRGCGESTNARNVCTWSPAWARSSCCSRGSVCALDLRSATGFSAWFYAWRAAATRSCGPRRCSFARRWPQRARRLTPRARRRCSPYRWPPSFARSPPFSPVGDRKTEVIMAPGPHFSLFKGMRGRLAAVAARAQPASRRNLQREGPKWKSSTQRSHANARGGEESPRKGQQRLSLIYGRPPEEKKVRDGISPRATRLTLAASYSLFSMRIFFLATCTPSSCPASSNDCTVFLNFLAYSSLLSSCAR